MLTSPVSVSNLNNGAAQQRHTALPRALTAQPTAPAHSQGVVNAKLTCTAPRSLHQWKDIAMHATHPSTLSQRSGWLRATSKRALSSIHACDLRQAASSLRNGLKRSSDSSLAAAFLSSGALAAATCQGGKLGQQGYVGPQCEAEHDCRHESRVNLQSSFQDKLCDTNLNALGCMQNDSYSTKLDRVAYRPHYTFLITIKGIEV
jgi:hypothetical protein